MAEVSANDLKQGLKIEMDNQPYVITQSQFVKPGKGQAFCRVKLKSLVTGRVVEKTYKSNENLALADVEETRMRLLYKEQDGAVFMDETSYEQVTIPNEALGDVIDWLLEDLVYAIVLYRGNAVAVEAPTFMEVKISETDPGIKGDTASGRVLKPAVTETGAKVQVPIFINQGEMVKFDTRTGEYVGRASK